MTNMEKWLRCAEPADLLRQIEDRLSPRKLRHFAVACSRRIAHLLPDEKSRKAVVVAERHADGLATDQELAAQRQPIPEKWTAREYARWAVSEACLADARFAAWGSMSLSDQAALFAESPWSERVCEAEKSVQCCLLRDIVGDPYFPVVFPRAWRTSTVFEVAQAIYDRHDFAALPILADALRDAGCDEDEILWHCEMPYHARGCWLLDHILGMK